MPFSELPIDIFELPDSRDTDWSAEAGKKTQTRTKMVTGYNSPEEAAQAAVDEPNTSTPLVIPYDPITGLPAMILKAVKAKPLQPNVYELTFSYESVSIDENEDPLTWSFSGSTSGGTQSVSQAISYRRYGTGPDYGGAINVDTDGVKGVDIIVPQLEFQIQKTLQRGVLTLPYVATMVKLTGTVNGAPIWGFAMRELLFMGGEFSQKSNAEVSCTFKFVCSPNRLTANGNALTIGDITNVEKYGHEYMWIDYKAVDSGGYVIRQPRTVHVDQVYQDGDFTLLQI